MPADGPVSEATLRRLQELDEADSPLGAIALMLAQTLDAGAGMATAAVAKELRATLKELTPRDGGDPFAEFMASLSSEVRYSAAPGSADAGV